LNESNISELDIFIGDFNQKIADFNAKYSVSEKQIVVKSINTSRLEQFTNQSSATTIYSTKAVVFNQSKINIALESVNSNLSLALPEAEKSCCINNRCSNCGVQKKYPILLLHGHSFNQDISADNSINVFDSVQLALESRGYLNAGELYLYEATRNSSGILGMINQPIAVRASYYFDFLQKPEGYLTVQIKSENIDTYAIRLKEIIESVKYETGSPKVIIISHSMGGLVARRYIQVFGNDSVDKIIMIATPNKGITGKIIQYCGLFGASLECRDLNSNSLFLNKLNTQRSDTVKITNIVGVGCNMNGDAYMDGDGVVLKDNAALAESGSIKNYYINGSCTSTDFLHLNILDTTKYPELMPIIGAGLS